MSSHEWPHLVQVGEELSTQGGWTAKVVWVTQDGFYAIHKPGTREESIPIFHLHRGPARSAFSVNEPPSYGKHPADITSSQEKS